MRPLHEDKFYLELVKFEREFAMRIATVETKMRETLPQIDSGTFLNNAADVDSHISLLIEKGKLEAQRQDMARCICRAKWDWK